MSVSKWLSIAFVEEDIALVAANLWTKIEWWLTRGYMLISLSLSLHVCRYVSMCLSSAFVEEDVALGAANLNRTMVACRYIYPSLSISIYLNVYLYLYLSECLSLSI